MSTTQHEYCEVDYTSQTTPTWYTCYACQKTNVKLWRQPHKRKPMLLCACCLALVAGVEIRKDGMTAHPTTPYVLTYEIKGYLPALASSVPHYFLWSDTPAQDLRTALDWWYALPTYTKA